ncbi:MAG: pilus assembly protein TadG-related protein [Pseudomonadota bacterium]|nr:pilus assembly protein TadG-related protein [Pseudomonadota bacterium]
MNYPSETTQRGIVLPIVAIAMTVLIGMAGLALDLSRGYLDKARLETAVDAAALAGAKVVNELGNTAAAQQDAADAAVTAFDFHLEGDLAAANTVPAITFSTTLAGPFAPLPVADARYVRAAVTGLPSPVLLARVIPGVADQLTIDASAVAGPSPPLGTSPEGEVCELAPILACAEDPAAENFGFPTDVNELWCLKEGVPGTTADSSGCKDALKHGNFQLVELECGPGGACVREELAGGSRCSYIGESITTKPGNTVGPTAQGYNTRFNVYQGAGMNPDDHPPDTITTEGIWYAEYEARQAAGPHNVASLEDGGDGVPGRRILAVPVGSCDEEMVYGRDEVPVVGIACFFMYQQANPSNPQEIYGQFLGECDAAGDIAQDPGVPGPGGGPELYKIILYNDMASADS